MMCKRVQDLPSTNSLGEKAFETFTHINASNLLHLLSFDDKEAALKHFFDLLEPGGTLSFTHLVMNMAEGDPLECTPLRPGIYAVYPSHCDFIPQLVYEEGKDQDTKWRQLSV